jgi:hypothetical protein
VLREAFNASVSTWSFPIEAHNLFGELIITS